MGTFSTDPFGNNAAGCFKGALVDQMMKPIRLVVSRKTLRSARYHYEAARAAVQFVIAHNPEILRSPPRSRRSCASAATRLRHVEDDGGRILTPVGLARPEATRSTLLAPRTPA